MYDEALCIIPQKRIKYPLGMLGIGDDCQILWTDGSEYTAKLLAIGKSYVVTISTASLFT